MDVSVSLARAANVAGGHLDVLGLGWNIIGPSPLPSHVLLASVSVPGDHADRSVAFAFELRHGSGEPVILRDDDAAQPVQISAEVVLPPASAVPDGLQRETTAIVEIASGMTLEPGIYEWLVSVDGESRPDWRRRFYVRAKVDEYRSADAD